jgi:hypothetical protein
MRFRTASRCFSVQEIRLIPPLPSFSILPGASSGLISLIDEVERPLQPGPQIRPAATEFVWRRLNEETQVVSVGGVVVAVLYTVPAGSTVGNLLEFCWLPVDRPDQVGVLFGAADGTGEPWIKRWEHARAAVETLLRANQTLP